MRTTPPRTRHVRALVLFVPAVAVSALIASACVDTTAIDYKEQAITALPPADASSDAEGADLRRPCQRCAETPDVPGPGCGTAVAACTADATCALVYQCAVARGCLEKSSHHDVVVCGIPCAAENGVVTTSDPVVPLILGITECVSEGACGSVCAGADAGP
jgi:hypothetical protein